MRCYSGFKVDIREHYEQGYLPAAMLNNLVRLGWSVAKRGLPQALTLIEACVGAVLRPTESGF